LVLIFLLPIILAGLAQLMMISRFGKLDDQYQAEPNVSKDPMAPSMKNPDASPSDENHEGLANELPVYGNSTVTIEDPVEYDEIEVPPGQFKISGCVCNGNGPVGGALVIMSTVNFDSITDLEAITEDEVQFEITIALTDGSYYFPPLFHHGTNYWIMAFAAFHETRVAPIKMAEGSSTYTELVIERKDLRWTTSGYMDRGNEVFVIDLLEKERHLVNYGLRAALVDQTLQAEVVWDNTMTTGGDLRIGYRSSSSESHSDQMKQYPSSKDNRESLTLRLDDNEIDNMIGSSNSPILEIVVDSTTWTRDCNFEVTIQIE
jgi:hypothetical protein